MSYLVKSVFYLLRAAYLLYPIYYLLTLPSISYVLRPTPYPLDLISYP